MQTDDKAIAKLSAMIDDSRYIIAFTGAGISTESGIPDFRSEDGIWTKYKPIQFQDFISSAEKRRESWNMKFVMDEVIKTAQPNKGHMAVAALYEMDKLKRVITQNIDGLHQLSGIPDSNVIELHGNSTYAKCLDCGKHFELNGLKVQFQKTDMPPVCGVCNGYIKTATISFGQPMPIFEMQEAETETQSCDLFLVIGSSLVVYPAAGFPQIAKQNGSKLVIINRDETGLDNIADLVLHHEIGETLSKAVEILKNQ